MINWIVYYEDGSSFTSEDGGPGDAPRSGVQVVAVRDDQRTGRLLWHSADWYCWHMDEWVLRSDAGLYDYLRQPGTEKIVLQARGTTYNNFIKIYNFALADDRLPLKSGRDQREPEEPLQ